MNKDRLLLHQPDVVERLAASLQCYGAALDASATGVGKTYSACGVVRELKLPTLVVCPLVMRTVWERAAEYLGTEVSTINYEMLRTGRTPYAMEDRGDYRFNPAVKLAIFDEVHRCRGLDTDSSRLLIAAKRQKVPTLTLSATPAESPIHMKALGYLLDLHSLDADTKKTLREEMEGKAKPTFWSWARALGVRPGPWGGMEWRVSEARRIDVMNRIRLQMKDKVVRLTTDMIPGFPKSKNSVELYDLHNSERIDEIYAEIAEAESELKVKEGADWEKAVEKHRLFCERNKVEFELEDVVVSPLVKILRARQRLELLMVPVMVELIDDSVVSGNSVAMFCEFKQTMLEVGARIREEHRYIWGDNTGPENAQNAEDFRADKFRVVLCQNAAGGVGIGLQDTRGRHPREGFHLPGFSAQNLIQAHGRLPRAEAKSNVIQRVVLANCQTHRQLRGVLAGKMNAIDTLVDADLRPSNLAEETSVSIF